MEAAETKALVFESIFKEYIEWLKSKQLDKNHLLRTMSFLNSSAIGMYSCIPPIKHAEISDVRKLDMIRSETNSTMDDSFEEDFDASILKDILESDPKLMNENTQSSKLSPEIIWFKNNEKTVLDNFVIKKHLGQGAQGSVYLCEDLRDGTNLALKACKKQHVNKRNKLNDIYREVEVLLSTNHPFILKLK